MKNLEIDADSYGVPLSHTTILNMGSGKRSTAHVEYQYAK